jgi:NitT/TauT family transport system permease protein
MSIGELETLTARRSSTGLVIARVWREFGPPILLTVLIIGGWEAVMRIFRVSEILVPRPSSILHALIDRSDILIDASRTTLLVIFYGFVASAVIGIALALALVRLPWLYRATYPLIVLFQTVPKVALAPIFVIWFGYLLLPKVLLIIVISFFPITLNLITGLRSVDPNLLLLMRSVGCSSTETLARVMMPSALPHLFAGLKIAVTFAVIGAIVAEFAGANRGIGYLIQFASSQLDTALMFAALLVVSAMGVVLYYGLVLIEYFAIPWAVGIGARDI